MGLRLKSVLVVVPGLLGDVGVAVDQPRQHRLAREVDDLGPRRDGEVAAHRGDPVALDEDHGVLDRRSPAAVDQPAGADGDDPGRSRRGCRRGLQGGEREEGEGETG